MKDSKALITSSRPSVALIATHLQTRVFTLLFFMCLLWSGGNGNNGSIVLFKSRVHISDINLLFHVSWRRKTKKSHLSNAAENETRISRAREFYTNYYMCFSTGPLWFITQTTQKGSTRMFGTGKQQHLTELYSVTITCLSAKRLSFISCCLLSPQNSN